MCSRSVTVVVRVSRIVFVTMAITNMRLIPPGLHISRGERSNPRFVAIGKNVTIGQVEWARTDESGRRYASKDAIGLVSNQDAQRRSSGCNSFVRLARSSVGPCFALCCKHVCAWQHCCCCWWWWSACGAQQALSAQSPPSPPQPPLPPQSQPLSSCGRARPRWLATP